MITVQPSHRAPANQVHGNSMHPKVRAVLDRGLNHEWSSKEVKDLLNVDVRSAQQLMNGTHLRSFAHPTKRTEKAIRRVTGLSLLLYLIKYSDEISEADAQPIIKKVLPLLTNQILEGVMGACKALIHSRSSLMVVVKPAAETPEPPKAASGMTNNECGTPTRSARPHKADPYAGMAELFPIDETGAPKTTTATTTTP